MYNAADIKKEILEILKKEKISKLSEIFKHTDFGKSVLYRNNLNKDLDIINLVKLNRTNEKKDLLKRKAPEIEEIRRRALSILTTEEEKSGETSRKNAIIYRIDFLCTKLHISTSTFYDYKLHEDSEIRKELDINREILKIDGYSKLLNSKQATGVLAFIKLVGNEDERKRVATTFQQIKGNYKVEHTLADEIKELMSYEYIEESEEIHEIPETINPRSRGEKD